MTMYGKRPHAVTGPPPPRFNSPPTPSSIPIPKPSVSPSVNKPALPPRNPSSFSPPSPSPLSSSFPGNNKPPLPSRSPSKPAVAFDSSVFSPPPPLSLSSSSIPSSSSSSSTSKPAPVPLRTRAHTSPRPPEGPPPSRCRSPPPPHPSQLSTTPPSKLSTTPPSKLSTTPPSKLSTTPPAALPTRARMPNPPSRTLSPPPSLPPRALSPPPKPSNLPLSPPSSTVLQTRALSPPPRVLSPPPKPSNRPLSPPPKPTNRALSPPPKPPTLSRNNNMNERENYNNNNNNNNNNRTNRAMSPGPPVPPNRPTMGSPDSPRGQSATLRPTRSTPSHNIPSPRTMREMGSPKSVRESISMRKGTLHKFGGGTWKEKFFVLQNGIFAYYNISRDLAARLIMSAADCTMDKEVRSKRNFSLHITNRVTGKQIYIAASSQEILDEWVDALRAAGTIDKTVPESQQQRDEQRALDRAQKQMESDLAEKQKRREYRQTLLLDNKNMTNNEVSSATFKLTLLQTDALDMQGKKTYKIEVFLENQTWQIFRNPSKVIKLYATCCKLKEIRHLEAPKKKGKKTDSAEDQKEVLQAFFNTLASCRPQILSHNSTKDTFLKFIAPINFGDIKPQGFVMPFQFKL